MSGDVARGFVRAWLSFLLRIRRPESHQHFERAATLSFSISYKQQYHLHHLRPYKESLFLCFVVSTCVLSPACVCCCLPFLSFSSLFSSSSFLFAHALFVVCSASHCSSVVFSPFSFVSFFLFFLSSFHFRVSSFGLSSEGLVYFPQHTNKLAIKRSNQEVTTIQPTNQSTTTTISNTHTNNYRRT